MVWFDNNSIQLLRFVAKPGSLHKSLVTSGPRPSLSPDTQVLASRIARPNGILLIATSMLICKRKNRGLCALFDAVNNYESQWCKGSYFFPDSWKYSVCRECKQFDEGPQWGAETSAMINNIARRTANEPNNEYWGEKACNIGYICNTTCLLYNIPMSIHVNIN